MEKMHFFHFVIIYFLDLLQCEVGEWTRIQICWFFGMGTRCQRGTGEIVKQWRSFFNEPIVIDSVKVLESVPKGQKVELLMVKQIRALRF